MSSSSGQRSSEKIDPASYNDHPAMSRQVTLNLNPEQYERLFFQPTAAKGDLSKRLGNPTLLGTTGFLIPFTTTVLCLLQWRGAGPSSFAAISGTYYFLGGIAMNLAGICEFILGNTFPFAVFVIYGCHWCNLAFQTDASHGIVAEYGKLGANAPAYAGAQGHYNVVMGLISFCFFLGAMRTNIPFAIAIFCLMPLFFLIAAAQYATTTATTAADVEHILYLLKISGGFGLVTAIAGWYLALELACASTGVPFPLPVFDLSHILFKNTKAAAIEAGQAGQREIV